MKKKSKTDISFKQTLLQNVEKIKYTFISKKVKYTMIFIGNIQ